MKRLGELILALNLHYTQLIHWTPFDQKQRGTCKASEPQAPLGAESGIG
jgi:hypothetical protein